MASPIVDPIRLPAQPTSGRRCILAPMTSQTLDAEPACPGAAAAIGRTYLQRDPTILRAERRPFVDIAPAIWDGLAACNPWATPFSAWAFHRAWWDAYGENAHEETVVVVPGDAPPGADPIAIVPLMHRYEVEPSDALTHTRMRHGADMELTTVSPTATGIFFGASYHADYATVLADPRDLPAVSDAVATYLGGGGAHRWDVVDLRRLRCGDPAADELAAALGAREMTHGWTLNVEREDVCPVATLPDVADVDAWLGTLGKKQRHEIRRKVRRAEAVGEVRLTDSPDPLGDLEFFIDLHQKRWGDDGLFPATPGGEQSRVLFRRLFELFGPAGPLRLTILSVGPRRIAAGIHFETRDGYLYYNAGVDPEAHDLSPGVLMTYAYVVRALASGKRRLDFLRGDEAYKYEWGAVDEPIQRLLVRRRD
jgi:CelD/BcsL family acetyltransferase involved in cellulose biosynthesis